MSTRRAPAVTGVPLGLAALAPLLALTLLLTVPDAPAPRPPPGATSEPVPRSTVACPPAPVGRGGSAALVGGAVGAGVAVGAGTPTPKANEPAVTWPSSLETTRQLTV